MADKLFNCRFAREFANVNLICFPWAGGGSNFYALWGKDLPDFIEGNLDIKKYRYFINMTFQHALVYAPRQICIGNKFVYQQSK